MSKKSLKKQKKSKDEDIGLEIIIDQKASSEYEFQVQNNRILNILRSTIDKIKVCVSLPMLLNDNAAVLRNYLTEEEVNYVQSVCNRRLESSQNSLSLIRALRGVEEPISFRMTVVVEILWNNHSLREKLLHEYRFTADNPENTFISGLRNLLNVAERNLSFSGAEDRQRTVKLEKVQRQNAVLLEKINRMENILKQQKRMLEAQLKEKLLVKQQYEDKIAEMKLNFNLKLQKTICASEDIVAEKTEASELRQEHLREEAKQVTKYFDNFKKANILNEKTLRATRLKAELKVYSWIEKYDDNMWQKQNEFEEITRKFEEDKKQLQDLQQMFDEQEEEYVVLMNEKEEEERRERNSKMNIFLQNHSAKIIQRYWRGYKQRKMERKLLKKAGRRLMKKQKTEEVVEPAPEDDKLQDILKQSFSLLKKEPERIAEARSPSFSVSVERKSSGEQEEIVKGQKSQEEEEGSIIDAAKSEDPNVTLEKSDNIDEPST